MNEYMKYVILRAWFFVNLLEVVTVRGGIGAYVFLNCSICLVDLFYLKRLGKFFGIYFKIKNFKKLDLRFFDEKDFIFKKVKDVFK